MHRHTCTPNNSSGMVVLFFSELSNLIHFLRASHQSVATDKVLQLSGVDQWLRAVGMSERTDIAAGREQGNLECGSAGDGCAQGEARKIDHDGDCGGGGGWRDVEQRAEGKGQRSDVCVMGVSRGVAMTLARAAAAPPITTPVPVHMAGWLDDQLACLSKCSFSAAHLQHIV